MNKVFSGQTKLTITIELNTAITDVDTAVIQYETPRAVKGEWPATIVDSETGILRLEISTEQQTRPAGRWKVWPKLTYVDGKIIYGTVNTIDFNAPGTA
jgi:hypothetical protein